MKKFFRVLLLTGVLAAILCVCALAEDAPAPTSSGIYDLEWSDSPSQTSTAMITVSGTASSVTIDGEEYADFYADADQVTVSYSVCKTGSYYLLFALNDDSGIPTVSNLTYIDQVTAVSDSVTFTVYPGSLTSGTYYIYMSSNNDDALSSAVPVASFKYYSAYKLGDVNNDTFINSSDAVLVLKRVVNALVAEDVFIPEAADINHDTFINSSDAVLILRRVVGSVDENFNDK